MKYSVFSLIAILHTASAISANQIASYWKGAGGSSSTCPMAVAIALAESGGNCGATGRNPGSYDRGLWQINSKWHPDVSDSCAYNCACNAKNAKRISSSGNNWSPWSTYKNGAYKKHLSSARSACGSRSKMMESGVDSFESEMEKGNFVASGNWGNGNSFNANMNWKEEASNPWLSNLLESAEEESDKEKLLGGLVSNSQIKDLLRQGAKDLVDQAIDEAFSKKQLSNGNQWLAKLLNADEAVPETLNNEQPAPTGHTTNWVIGVILGSVGGVLLIVIVVVVAVLVVRRKRQNQEENPLHEKLVVSDDKSSEKANEEVEATTDNDELLHQV